MSHVPTDSSPAPSRWRLAALAAAVLVAVIAWQIWPDDAATSLPSATASAPPPAPRDSPDAGPVEPAPAILPGVPDVVPAQDPAGPVPSASPDTPPDRPVPSTSDPTPAAAATRPGKPPRDPGKPPAPPSLSREALRARLARELAACGSPYVAEEITVRVTPRKAGKLAGLAAIADDRLAAGTVACLERELARVQAGLTDNVDAARAFDVSLTLPRRGGG